MEKQYQVDFHNNAFILYMKRGGSFYEVGTINGQTAMSIWTRGLHGMQVTFTNKAENEIALS